MNDLTLRQVQEKRYKLGIAVLNLIQTFENETHLSVNLSLIKTQPLGAPFEETASVLVEVTL